jgi:hypothetical protein
MAAIIAFVPRSNRIALPMQCDLLVWKLAASLTDMEKFGSALKMERVEVTNALFPRTGGADAASGPRFHRGALQGLAVRCRRLWVRNLQPREKDRSRRSAVAELMRHCD